MECNLNGNVPTGECTMGEFSKSNAIQQRQAHSV